MIIKPTRWGQQVFESADAYQGWDGTRNGQPASAGTYVWTINYTDILGHNQSRRGTLILVQ